MHEVRSIEELLKQVWRGEIMLPEFQRGYVWTREQVRGLVQSLYRKHPTGHLLIWRTYKPSLVRGTSTARDGHSLLLLDGQQRLTTLFVLFNGKAPPFYEGESLFFDLYFNMQTGEFRFWQNSLMGNNPAWIGLHEFLKVGLNGLLERLNQLDEDRRGVIQDNLSNLSRLDQIRNYTYTVDQVSGEEFGVNEVVDIFNRVNKAGTPLTKADLALAHVCSIWPEARAELRDFQAAMAGHGFEMDFNFLVRCLAGVSTGSVLLEGSFLKTPASTLQTAWKEMQPAFENLLNILRHEAYIDNVSDLPTSNVLIPTTVFLARNGGQFPTDAVKKRFIRWFFLAGLWQRYSGAAESTLQHDVALVAGRDLDPTPELEATIVRDRGRVTLEASDLNGAGISTAVARLSHIVARAHDARDWFTGIRLYDKMVGKSNGQERHHIFPKAVLAKVGFESGVDTKLINELANRAILTQPPARLTRSSLPSDYLPAIEENQPGALRAQSVPRDRKLWDPENYLDFLAARRRLLAEAMNTFIESWDTGDDAGGTDEQTVRCLMAGGENETLEFKSSLRWDRHENRVNKELEKVVVKTLAGFLNGKGGTLLLGVDDASVAVGLAVDYGTLRKQNRDGFELHLQQIVARDLGEAASSYLMVTFHEIDGQDICQITVEPSEHPIYVADPKAAVFYLRTGNATKALPVPETVKYVQRRWGRVA